MGKWRKKSNTVATPETDGIVTSKDTGRVRLRARMKRVKGRQVLLATMIVMGVGILVGTAVYFWPEPSPQADDTYTKAQSELQNLSQGNTYNIGQGKAAESIPELEAYLANGDLPADLRGAALGQLATAYINDKQYAKAIETYGQLSQLEGHETYTTASGTAMAYEIMGDRANALTYYQQAIRLGEEDLKTQASGNGDIYTLQQQLNVYHEKVKKLQEAP